MIEKVKIQMTKESGFRLEGTVKCNDLNPKAMMLFAAAKCVGLTILNIMQKEKIQPKHLEIGISGELSADNKQSEAIYKSFNVVYNIECHKIDEQIKVSRAVNLAHDKYCGMLNMLRMIAPVSHEIAIVSTEPASV